MAEDSGRNPDELEVTVFGPNPDEEELRELADAGVHRVIFLLMPEKIEKLLPLLDERKALAETIG
jgi:uncharacterized protein (DUF1015 family)